MNWTLSLSALIGIPLVGAGLYYYLKPKPKEPIAAAQVLYGNIRWIANNNEFSVIFIGTDGDIQRFSNLVGSSVCLTSTKFVPREWTTKGQRYPTKDDAILIDQNIYRIPSFSYTIIRNNEFVPFEERLEASKEIRKYHLLEKDKLVDIIPIEWIDLNNSSVKTCNETKVTALAFN